MKHAGKRMGIVCLALCALTLGGCAGNVRDVFFDMEPTESPPAVSEEPPVIRFTHYMTPPPLVFEASAPRIRGLYVTSNRAGSKTGLNDLIELCWNSSANAMVIDVKTEEGVMTYYGFDMADQLGISVPNIPDIQALTQTLRENQIYTIARLVTFKDNNSYHFRPELYIKNKDGSIWKDTQKNAWLNPYNPDAREYALEFAKAAAAAGFQEIQFDYIRFPASMYIEEEADLGDTGGKTRSEAIADFARLAMETLKPYGVKVSADVYGAIINSDTDAAIVGQDYMELAKILDVICPMVYPSHYAKGSMGLDNPDLLPYDTLYKSMRLSGERLAGIPEGEHRAIVRPWLQDFTATWVHPHLDYAGKERGEQIQGAYDAELSEWLLWDPGNHYDAEGMDGWPGAADAIGAVGAAGVQRQGEAENE
ncbi:MAG: putative glycoside hydrolase [Clostridiales bacterium]|jgi:hypothetical protein|nr:putative glycoside hydrolase [Clostridiales bacterium]